MIGETQTFPLDVYHALLEQGSDLVAILDADGTFLHVSPSYERVQGYTMMSLAG